MLNVRYVLGIFILCRQKFRIHVVVVVVVMPHTNLQRNRVTLEWIYVHRHACRHISQHLRCDADRKWSVTKITLRSLRTLVKSREESLLHVYSFFWNCFVRWHVTQCSYYSVCFLSLSNHSMYVELSAISFLHNLLVFIWQPPSTWAILSISFFFVRPFQRKLNKFTSSHRKFATKVSKLWRQRTSMVSYIYFRRLRISRRPRRYRTTRYHSSMSIT